MNIGIIGSGGREHALSFKLKQSKIVDKIYCIPGNAGTKLIAENIYEKTKVLALGLKDKFNIYSKEFFDTIVINTNNMVVFSIQNTPGGHFFELHLRGIYII